MMGFAFWFLLNNVSNYFVEPTEFSELTVLIPGVTLTSSASITYFLLSIPIVLVIHEGAHGIVATLEKIKIKTGGFAIFIALFAVVLPEPILGWMYEEPDGVLVLSIIEGSGAEKAGLQPNDIITAINGIDVRTPLDFQKADIVPGQTVNVSILRAGQQLELPIVIMPSEDEPERGSF